MQYIYLPGMSQNNQSEQSHFTEYFFDVGHEIITFPYKNWINENNEFDFKFELKATCEIIQTKIKEELALICKSVGTILGISSIVHLKIQVKKLVLMGIPSDMLSSNVVSFHEAIDKSEEVFIILNEFDPYIDQDLVRELINKKTNVALEIIENVNIHKYFYAQRVLEFVT